MRPRSPPPRVDDPELWTGTPTHTVIERPVPGGMVRIDRDHYPGGHVVERGHTPGRTADEVFTPESRWVRYYHPYGERPLEHQPPGRTRHTTELGETHLREGRSVHTIISVTGRDAQGRTWHSAERSDYVPSTGQTIHTTMVSDASGNRSWSSVDRHADGTWSITTTTVNHRHQEGRTHVTTGRGDQVTSDETTDFDGEEPDEPDEPDPPELDEPDDDEERRRHGGSDHSPVGDGTDGTQEGNPDADLARVDLDALGRFARRMRDEGELLDGLGDIDPHLVPWLDRLAAVAGSGGPVVEGELVDSLGAPPPVSVDPGSLPVPDEFRDLDALGRPLPAPPPVVDRSISVTDLTGGEAVSLTTITDLAGALASEVAEIAASRDLLRSV